MPDPQALRSRSDSSCWCCSAPWSRKLVIIQGAPARALRKHCRSVQTRQTIELVGHARQHPRPQRPRPRAVDRRRPRSSPTRRWSRTRSRAAQDAGPGARHARQDAAGQAHPGGTLRVPRPQGRRRRSSRRSRRHQSRASPRPRSRRGCGLRPNWPRPSWAMSVSTTKASAASSTSTSPRSRVRPGSIVLRSRRHPNASHRDRPSRSSTRASPATTSCSRSTAACSTKPSDCCAPQIGDHACQGRHRAS